MINDDDIYRGLIMQIYELKVQFDSTIESMTYCA